MLRLLAFVVFASTAVTQSTDSSTSRSVALPELGRGVIGMGWDEGALWAAGDDYKVAFTALGARFYPAYGAASARHLPLCWEVSEIVRGATHLPLAAAVEPARDRDSVVYARGAVVERYDIRPASIEQSFVFAERSGGDGDLVVRLRLRTELRAEPRADGSLEFALPGLGGVHVGGVTGIDANGRRGAGTLRLVGDMLELALPDAFVDSAVFPLTLDPVYSALLAVTPTIGALDPDIAFLDSSGDYFVVYTREHINGDHDVYGQRVSAAGGGSLVGGWVLIDISTTNSSNRARAAYITATDRCLVVWQQNSTAQPLTDVRCATVDAAGGSVIGKTTIGASSGNDFNAVVAGDPTTSDDEAVVVYENDTEINMCQVTVQATAAPVLGTVRQLAAGAGVNHPAISKACQPRTFYLVVAWQAPGAQSADIHAQLITRDITRIGPVLAITSGALDDNHPAVDGSMIVFDRAETAAAGALHDIAGVTVSASSAGLTLVTPVRSIVATAGDEVTPDLVRMGDRYCVVYREVSAGQQLPWALVVNPDCTPCNRKDLLVENVTPAVSFVRVNAATPYRSSEDGGLVCKSQSSQGFRPTVSGYLFRALSPGTPPVDLGGACGAGSTSSWNNTPFVVGNGDFAFTTSGVAPGALLLFSIGIPGNPLPCGPCTLTNPVVLMPVAHNGGFATLPYPVPCDPIYIDAALEVQWLSLATSSNACPVLPGLSASSRRVFTVRQ